MSTALKFQFGKIPGQEDVRKVLYEQQSSTIPICSLTCMVCIPASNTHCWAAFSKTVKLFLPP